jgi:hypothetical protein
LAASQEGLSSMSELVSILRTPTDGISRKLLVYCHKWRMERELEPEDRNSSKGLNLAVDDYDYF